MASRVLELAVGARVHLVGRALGRLAGGDFGVVPGAGPYLSLRRSDRRDYRVAAASTRLSALAILSTCKRLTVRKAASSA